jgi:hypothetical protein
MSDIDWSSAPAWAHGVGEITQFAGLWYIGHDKYAAVEAPEVTLFFKKAVFPMRKNVVKFQPRPKEWPSDDRIDIVGTNGNDGLHYNAPERATSDDLSKPVSAAGFLSEGLKTLSERGRQYDPNGKKELSFNQAAEAFNAVTGKAITGADVCLVLVMLKIVRQNATDGFHLDSAVDGVNYMALWAELLSSSDHTQPKTAP